MQKTTKYTVFRTKWGFFGLAGDEAGLCRTCLPAPKAELVKAHLLEDRPEVNFEPAFCRGLQQQIAAYFEGQLQSFELDIPLVLDGLAPFSRSVLTSCRSVQFGQVITYHELARRAGRPAASRAVGSALARNPLPLLIPCHRIIRTDGRLGGFSAPGGVELKQKMIDFERSSRLVNGES